MYQTGHVFPVSKMHMKRRMWMCYWAPHVRPYRAMCMDDILNAKLLSENPNRRIYFVVFINIRYAIIISLSLLCHHYLKPFGKVNHNVSPLVVSHAFSDDIYTPGSRNPPLISFTPCYNSAHYRSHVTISNVQCGV